ncbi:acyl-CoA dehydrogenase family protein [Rhodovibrionaceae bacterium A322]
MDFTFTEEQGLMAASLEGLLQDCCQPSDLRETAASQEPNSQRWSALTELGLNGLLLPESRDGLDQGLCDAVMLAQVAGRFALPEPLIEQAFLLAPLLDQLAVSLDGAAPQAGLEKALTDLLAGQVTKALSHPLTPYLSDLRSNSAILLLSGTAISHLQPGSYDSSPLDALDPLRQLSKITPDTQAPALPLPPEDAARLSDVTALRGALLTAAQLQGLAEALLSQALEQAKTREQFGQVIGGFQALKHQLADVQTSLTFSEPLLYQAAFALDQSGWDTPSAQTRSAVAQAKLAAGELARQAARTALQVFGAMGYTYEADLHFWMKRAWALTALWGDLPYQRKVLTRLLLDQHTPLAAGPARGFGQSCRSHTPATSDSSLPATLAS